MIEATIKNDTLRCNFAKKGHVKKIGSAKCIEKPIVKGIVLDNYSLLGSGFTNDKKLTSDLSNVIMFKKQKEVA